MHCQEVEKMLDGYLAGQLDPGFASQIERHLESCSTCQSLFLQEDPELDSLLQGDWYLVDTPADWSARMLLPLADRESLWKKIGVAAFLWSSYLAVWGLIAFGLYRSSLLADAVAGFKRIGSILTLISNTVQIVWRALQMIQVSPFVCILLLLASGLAISGLRHMEKEGLA